MARYGITPAALNDTDEWNRNREYNNRVKQAAEELNKAVQEQANPETVGAIVRRLSEAQGANTARNGRPNYRKRSRTNWRQSRNNPTRCGQFGRLEE